MLKHIYLEEDSKYCKALFFVYGIIKNHQTYCYDAQYVAMKTRKNIFFLLVDIVLI